MEAAAARCAARRPTSSSSSAAPRSASAISPKRCSSRSASNCSSRKSRSARASRRGSAGSASKLVLGPARQPDLGAGYRPAAARAACLRRCRGARRSGARAGSRRVSARRFRPATSARRSTAASLAAGEVVAARFPGIARPESARRRRCSGQAGGELRCRRSRGGGAGACVFDRSISNQRRRHARDPGLEPEQPAGKRLLFERVRPQQMARGRGEGALQVGSAECDLGDVGNGKADAVERARRRASSAAPPSPNRG